MLAVLLSGCGFVTGESGDSAGGECRDLTLRLATIRTDDDPTTLGATAFAEGVEAATEGQVTVEVYPNSQLGDANDLYAGVAAGDNLDMFYEGISTYSTLEGAEAFTVTTVPFLWDSYEQFRAVLESDRYTELLDEAATSTGARVIAIGGDAEPRALSADRPIQTAEDMKGLKLRIADAPLPQEFAKALGARPQVIPFSDLYFSLRQGVVEAQENGAITMVNQSLMEVQDYYMPIDYIRDIRVWYFTDSTWQSICAEHQEVLRQQAEQAGDVTTQETEKQMTEAMATLEEHLEVVDVDRESFRSALEGVFEQFDGQMWPEGLLEETRALAEEHS
ncbi:TRAP transporter substrate-binding protein [Ornithinimicrobium cavernae]|uniref:TRAP transporter substrate-binding protein n=1 Tax=Ornithinimicrobium cavernae TaxID=2666047 RepID=UPI00137AA4ED|nr:TRAP transporter substrate-binding protein [Ornithinimicrobium cavernae]